MTPTDNGTENGVFSTDRYRDKSDHEIILILEEQVSALNGSLNASQRQNDSLLKTQGQISVVRLVFTGVLLLIASMVVMSIASWWSPKATTGIEKELAFFERLLLVMLGILSSAAAQLFDQRNNNHGTGGGE